MPQVFIGTSGFSYSHWREGVFYPKGLSVSEQLQYYSRYLKTVELNNTFYRLPSSKTFQHWYVQTPANFTFAVKVSRFITHIKKLSQCDLAWKKFFSRSVLLKNKLGPFLFQFPPTWHEDARRLESFLAMLKRFDSNRQYRYVFEFRHSSWFCQKIYALLKKYKISLCVADSDKFPLEKKITTEFVYVRMHGRVNLYNSNYSHYQLKNLAKQIKQWLKLDLDVYVYFNNDAFGYAVENARYLNQFFAS